ncbi:aconitase family protein, partial [Streptomyces sp. NWU339]|uniref:aconitase family protein n=1 Tax=Streptomyces sp. NWU339 TaxID=2185284 RepID=UPI00215AB659
AAGSLGMLALGTGGLEVALSMAGRPLHVTMPEIWGIRLTGHLSEWVSAKDVVLEMLRRHGVKGAVNRILEYHGPGLAGLTAMDRHVIANMGAELGATTSVFPSDSPVRDFLRAEDRETDFRELASEPDAVYDLTDEIDLSTLETRTAHRPPHLARQCRPSTRGHGRAHRAGSHRLLRQSGAARLRHRRGHRHRPPDRPRRQLRRQPHLPRDPRRPHQDGFHLRPDRRRCPYPVGLVKSSLRLKPCIGTR